MSITEEELIDMLIASGRVPGDREQILLGALVKDAQCEFRSATGHIQEYAEGPDPRAKTLGLVADVLAGTGEDGCMIRTSRVLSYGALTPEDFAACGFSTDELPYIKGPTQAYQNTIRDGSGRYRGYLLDVPPFPDGSGRLIELYSPVCLRNALKRTERRLNEATTA